MDPTKINHREYIERQRLLEIQAHEQSTAEIKYQVASLFVTSNTLSSCRSYMQVRIPLRDRWSRFSATGGADARSDNISDIEDTEIKTEISVESSSKEIDLCRLIAKKEISTPFM